MIDNWLNKIDRLNQKNLFYGIVAASILLAAWMQYIQHGWINPDSVLYLEQARLFALGNWLTAVKIFNWPLYGACIGLVHKLTSLDVHTSAQLLNMLFFGAATASFLHLIKLAGGNNRTLFMGMLLLFSSLYIVGDVLEMLMRDEGFWAFYLTAIVFFIRYVQKQKLCDAVLWQLSIIIATLFRIEAILLILILPLTCILNQPTPIKEKLKQLLNAYSISIIIGIGITIAILTQAQLSMAQFGRLNEVFTSNLYQQFTQKLFTQAEIMSHQVLGEYLEEFAVPGLLLTFLYVMGSKILTATGLVGTGLALFGLKYSSKEMQPAVKRVLIAAASIALISMALIIIKVFILSSRYAVALGWILLIFASFYLSALSSRSNKKSRITFIIISLILSLSFIKNILPKREGYNYQQHAVTWVESINTDKRPVFYSDSRLRYYASAPFIGTFSSNWKNLESDIKNKNILQYDYLIINFSKRDKDLASTLNQELSSYKEIKRFYAVEHKKYCAIYHKQI